MSHQSKEIQDGEILYRYAKASAFPAGQDEIPSGVFQIQDLSCDWEFYQKDPKNSFHIKEGKEIIIQITICDDIRNPKNPKRGNPEPPWRQDIIHDPTPADESHPANESHSLIRGIKKKPVTDALIASSIILNKEQLHK